MTNNTYDICPILVSKEASGQLHSHLLIRLWFENEFIMLKLNRWSEFCFIHKFRRSFEFLCQKEGIYGQHFQTCLDFEKRSESE